MTWSDGQTLAREQLEDIADAANGHFAIEQVIAPPDEASRAMIVVSLTTAHFHRAAQGLPLKAREKLVIHVPREFPFEAPCVHASHKRWAGFPHVQWGDYLCLFQSTNIEYAPSDGMFGFVERLNIWLAAGALGQLDPDDAPLHPPSVAATADERVVIYADAPTLDAESWQWIGAARCVRRNERRLDLTEWIALDSDFPVAGDRETIAAAVILNKPLPFEYPKTVKTLIIELVRHGMSIDLLLKVMRLYTLSLPDGAPLYFVIGAPARRRAAGEEVRSHLAIWRVDALAAKALRLTLHDETGVAENIFYEWAGKTETAWCGVHEARPELTFRRDTGSRASWLNGKRILLLGCGAIGSHVGEYAARAGATRIDVVDNGIVTPGILVRQNFPNSWIAFGKARALEARLKDIRPDLTVTAATHNLKYGVATHFNLSEFDLIVDATASNPVTTKIDRELAQAPFPCPLLSLSVSAHAEHGMVLTRMPGATSGPIDITRRAKLASLHDQRSSGFSAAFWPKREDISLFQPEPGCSEPTFTGSALDLAGHSSALMNLGLERITQLQPDAASVDFIRAPATADRNEQLHRGFAIKPPLITTDARHGYRLFIDEIAKREILAWISRNKRVRGAKVETGGLIFGAIDESLRSIWLDRVSGPPPDSQASEEQFLCGTQGTRELAEYHTQKSGGSSGFIGIWHTHPISRPTPSIDDLDAMLQLLVLEQQPPRHVLMIIVGYAAGAPQLAAYLFRRREFQPVLERARRRER